MGEKGENGVIVGKRVKRKASGDGDVPPPDGEEWRAFSCAWGSSAQCVALCVELGYLFCQKLEVFLQDFDATLHICHEGIA